MGTFSAFLEEKKITPPMLVLASARLEEGGKEGRASLEQRRVKRRKEPTKTYADANLPKPPSGRGITLKQIQAAMKDVQLTRKVRTKIVQAVGAVLSKKGGGQIDHKTIFGEIAVKKGEKVEKAAVV
jgi:hypothetical protein